MALIKTLRGKMPQIGTGTFLAETAVVIGDVTLGDDCSVWYGAVLRGDVNTIRIGNRVNIQDNAVVHTLYEDSPSPSQTIIGDDVSVGHGAIVHGARIGDRCLIGMGSTVLDNAVVGEGCIVAAGALVLANSVLEPGGLYAGVPAKRVRDITPEQQKNIIERTARDYRTYAGWYVD